MEAQKLIKSSGVALLLLGILHLIAHFLGPKSQEVPAVIQMMDDYKIELMGTHSLLAFHLGFSIMTGLFMMTIGTFQLIHASKIDRAMLKTLMFFTLVSFVISVLYFHPLAYGLILVGVVFQMIAFAKVKP